MITKERLEELIKEEKYVWSTWGGEIKYMKPDEDYLTLGQKYLEQMFETEEDAKFALRFKRVPRTEYLDLLTWEEFCEFDKLMPGYIFSFISKDKETCSLYLFNDVSKAKPKEIILWNQRIGGKIIFDKVATKENYLEACEICRKLWLGEEV